MSTGFYPAGLGPAGFDAPADPSARDITRATLMPLFDVETRSVKLDENGNVLGVHPVDHEVSVQLGIALRSLPSSVSVGVDTSRARRVRRDNVNDVVEDMVRVALARLLRAKDIELVSVRAEFGVGRVAYEVEYKNLRLPNTQAQVRKGSFNAS
jgi:hypothetical protein